MKSEKTETDLRCSEDTAKKFRSSYFANWERVSTLPKSNGKVSQNISCKIDYKALMSGESPIRKKKKNEKDFENGVYNLHVIDFDLLDIYSDSYECPSY